MNILILQGSPRANGNTASMAKEFRKDVSIVTAKIDEQKTDETCNRISELVRKLSTCKRY